MKAQQYDNARSVANEAEILNNFKLRSLVCYQQYACVQDIQYSAQNRASLDLFKLEQATATVVFIHGGYWQWCDKSDFAFIVPALLAKNHQCVLLEYDLAPHCSLRGMVLQIKQAFDFIEKQDWITEEVIVIGHSAGAHLAALMQGHALVSRSILLSGLYNLAPIKKTHLNKALNLSTFEIVHYSPILQKQLFNKTCDIYCGDAELPELKWQSQEYYMHRLQLGEPKTKFSFMHNSNHYNILDNYLNQIF